MIGFALCGSFCTFKNAIEVFKQLISRGESIVPIMSFNASTINTRFGRAEDFISDITYICGSKPITTIEDAEPLGPKISLSSLLICPCTGNTLAKLASGITDTPVTMAAKAHLRCGRPLVIALASNDALGANLQNIAKLSEKKNVYFVPMLQDDPEKKPYSLVCDFSKAVEALDYAKRGVQLRPMILEKSK